MPRTDLPRTLAPLRLKTSHEAALAYADLTADRNPIHVDTGFAAKTPFGRPIAHGTMSLGLLLTCLEKSLGPDCDIINVDIRFSKPVPVGETIVADGHQSTENPSVYDVFVETEEGARALEGKVWLTPE